MPLHNVLIEQVTDGVFRGSTEFDFLNTTNVCPTGIELRGSPDNLTPNTIVVRTPQSFRLTGISSPVALSRIDSDETGFNLPKGYFKIVISTVQISGFQNLITRHGTIISGESE